jgi:hypothetical protein
LGQTAEDARGGVEEIDGIGRVHDHVALEAEALQYLGLGVRSSAGEGDESFAAETLDVLFEFAGVHVTDLFGLADLEFFEFAHAHEFELRLLLLEGELGLLENLAGLGLELGYLDLRATHDVQLLGEGLGLGLGLPRGLHRLHLRLEVVELATLFLGKGFVLDLPLLQGCLGFLLVFVRLLLRLGLLHLSRDLDRKGHQLLQGLLSLIINGLDNLDIDISDMQLIVLEDDPLLNLVVLVKTEYGGPDVSRGEFVEVFEGE